MIGSIKNISLISFKNNSPIKRKPRINISTANPKEFEYKQPPKYVKVKPYQPQGRSTYPDRLLPFVMSRQDFIHEADSDIYEEQLKKHPNTAFLYDTRYTADVRADNAKRHPEIIFLKEFESENGLARGMLSLEDFFEIDKIVISQYCFKKYIDKTYGYNGQNIERILKNKNRIMTEKEYSNVIRFVNGDIHGSIKPKKSYFELYSKEDGQLKPSPFIYLEDNNDVFYLLQAKKIGRAAKYFNQLVSQSGLDPVYANIKDLTKYGFGSYSQLLSLLKEKKLSGGKKKNNNGEYAFFVNLNDRNNERVLMDVRKQKCVELERAENIFGLSKNELMLAYLEGELDCYTDAVFLGDREKIFINLKSEKSINTLNRLLFEKELLFGLNPNNFYKSKTSQRIKIAWYFAENTRKIANEIVKSSPEIFNVIDKEKFPAASNVSEYSPEYRENKITYDDIKLLKSFFDKVWEKAGKEEYQEALKKAQELLSNYRSYKLNSIEDIELRNIVARTNGVSKRDFLTCS